MQFNKTFNLNDLNNFSHKKDKYFKNPEKGFVTKATWHDSLNVYKCLRIDLSIRPFLSQAFLIKLKYSWKMKEVYGRFEMVVSLGLEQLYWLKGED